MAINEELEEMLKEAPDMVSKLATKPAVSNIPFDNSIDYSKQLTTEMNAKNTDTDYLQGLLEGRRAKAASTPGLQQYIDDDFDKKVTSYIENLKVQNAMDPQKNAEGAYSWVNTKYQRPDDFSSQWDPRVEQLTEQALGMSFNDWLNSDEYKRLVDRYSNNGQKAMQNTVGQVSARTGGLASSYAQTAGQQSYNDYMSKLEEVARDMYDRNKNDIITNIGLASNLSDRDYERWLNNLNQYNTDRGWASGLWDAGQSQANYERSYQNDLENQQYQRDIYEQERQDQKEKEAQALNDDKYSSFYDAYIDAGDPATAFKVRTAWLQGIPFEEYFGTLGGAEKINASLTSSLLGTSSGSGSSGGSSGGSKKRTGSGNGGGGNDDPVYNPPAVTTNDGTIKSSMQNVTNQIKQSTGAEDNTAITNTHTSSYVIVPGYSRLTYPELQNLVDKGKIKEIYNSGKNTVTYKKA